MTRSGPVRKKAAQATPESGNTWGLMPDPTAYGANRPPTMQLDGETWLSVREAARRLSLWPRTVRRAATEGRIRSMRIGPDLWLAEAAVAEYRPVYGRGNWGPAGVKEG